MLSLTTWSGAVDDKWSTADNWSNGVPGAGDEVVLSSTTRTNTVNDLSGVTLKSIAFASDNLTLSASPGNSIRLTDGITVDTGVSSAAISAPLVLDGSTAINVVDAGAALTVSGVVSGSNSLQKTGAGSLVLGGANTYTGGTVISQGMLTLGNGSAIGLSNNGIMISGGSTLNVGDQVIAAGAVVLVDGTISGGTLVAPSYTVSSGEITANLEGNNATVVKISDGTVTLTGENTYGGLTSVISGTLELAPASQSAILTQGGANIQAGKIVFDYTNPAVDDPAATVQAILTTSYGTTSHFAVGNNAKIYSSPANAAGMALGWMDDGNSAVTVMYTLYGDANLTGHVDSADLLVLTNNFSTTSGATWAQGDFNYDGRVDSADLLQLTNSFGSSVVSQPPEILGIYRLGTNPTSAGTAQFVVLFSEEASGVDVADFQFAYGGSVAQTATVSSVVGYGPDADKIAYLVTVAGISGNGTIALALSDRNDLGTTITGADGALVGDGAYGQPAFLGQSYTIDSVVPDVALSAAIRQALGMAPDAILTTTDIAQLTSLSVDSNKVSSLEGLQYATNLTSLTLAPGDFSQKPSSPLSLTPLAGLTNLTTLALQDCGLTGASLGTTTLPANLQSLDLRYNNLGYVTNDVVPTSVATLSSLTSLFLYGNPFVDGTRAGLTQLHGKLINVDLAPDHPENATTVVDLAASLYDLPIEMYEYVVNTIEFQPYQNAMKGDLATLQTKGANDWDTDSLLASLFIAAGISSNDISYMTGTIDVAADTLENWLGVKDATAAHNVLSAAGLSPQDTTSGGVVTSITFAHTWLSVTINGSTYTLDPTWKFRDFQTGMGDMLNVVPFDASKDGDYLSEMRTETAGEYYEQQVRDYLADPANGLTDKTIADVAYDGPIHPQTFTSLPSTTPYTIVTSTNTGHTIGTSHQNTVQIAAIVPVMTKVDGIWKYDLVTTSYSNGYTTFTAWKWSGSTWVHDNGAFSEMLVSSSLYLYPQGDYGNQATVHTAQIASYTSAYPYQVRVAGDYTAYNNYCFGVADIYKTYKTSVVALDRITLGYATEGDGIVTQLSLTDADGNTTVQSNLATHVISPNVPVGILVMKPGSYSTYYGRSSGTPVAVGIDANQYSEQTLLDAWRAVNNAQIAKANGASNDAEVVNSLLYLDVVDYFYTCDTQEAIIDGLTGAMPNYNYVASGLSSASATVSYQNADVLIPYLPSGLTIDVRNDYYDSTRIDSTDSAANIVTRFNLQGFINSGLEAGIMEELTNAPSVSTIKSLQYANEYFGDNGVVTITSVNDIPSTLPSGVQTSIAGYLNQGKQVTVPVQVTPIRTDGLAEYDGVGYIVASYSQSLQGWTDYAFIIQGSVTSYSDGEPLFGGKDLGPSQPVTPVPPSDSNKDNTTGDPISIVNGELTYDATDFTIPNLGIDLAFSRRYDSANTVAASGTPWSDRGMGEGWSYSYSDKLTFNADSSITWFTADGVLNTFAYDAGSYTTPAGLFGTFEHLTGSAIYRWTDSHGSTVGFDESGKLVFEHDRYGNGVDLSYTYDSGTLTMITVSDAQNSSRWLHLNFASGLLTSVGDFTGRTWTYAYDGGRLASVTTPSDTSTPEAVTYYTYYSDNARLGLMETITNANGSVRKYDYYANRRGFQITLGYGTDDAVVQSMRYNLFRLSDSDFDGHTIYNDGSGSTTRYEYDSSGNILDTIYADLTDERSTYNIDNQVLSATDAYGQTEAYTYYADGTGDLNTYTDRDGNVTTFTYTTDAYHNVASIVAPGPNGNVTTTFTYDATGKSLTDIIEDAGTGNLNLHTHYTYDDPVFGPRGLPDTVTSPNGGATPGDSTDYVTEFDYNAAGQIVTQTQRVSATHSITEEMEYSNRGDLTQYVDGEGNTTVYTYDLRDRVIATTYPDPDGPGGDLAAPHVTYTYDYVGNVLTVTDDTVATDTRTTTYVRDYMGRITRTTNADGTYTTVSYDQAGNTTSATDELGRVTNYVYDHLDRCIATIALDGTVTRTIYGGDGRVTATIDALGNTTEYQYDVLGRVTERSDALNQATAYAYDDAGNITSVTDALNHATTYAYDNLGRLLSQTDALSGTTSYTYDMNGNVLTLTDPESNATTWVYDEANRQIQETDELNASRYFAYDDVGNLIRYTDRNGRMTTHDYDHLGRETAEHWLDSQENDIETFSYVYDAWGDLISASDPSATYTYTYDTLGRVTSERQVIAGLTPAIGLRYTYDAAGQRTQTSTMIGSAADAVTDYAYDSLGRVVSVEQYGLPDGNAIAEKRVDLTYDLASQWKTITRYADLAGTQQVVTGTYTFDAAGRLTGLAYAQPNSTGLPLYSWQFDAANRMTQMVSADGAVNYTNDATGQLTGADYNYQADENYTYDSNGNRTNTAYSTGDDNQLLSDGTFTYEYDAEGNRTLRTRISSAAADDYTTEYTWDYRNRLTSVTLKNTSGTVTKTVTYVYDVYNRWLGETISVPGQAVEQTRYVYDGPQIIAQFDKTGTGSLSASDLSHRYLWNPQAVDQLFADEQTSSLPSGQGHDLSTPGTVLWALTDHQNTIRDLAAYNAQSNQTTIANHRVYDSFGTLKSQTDAAIECLFGYTGRPLDAATGLQNNVNRWYDAATGCWLSQDSLGFAAGDRNLYRYVGNSPTTFIDPSGLAANGSASGVGRWGPVFAPKWWWDQTDKIIAGIEKLIGGNIFSLGNIDKMTNGYLSALDKFVKNPPKWFKNPPPWVLTGKDNYDDGWTFTGESTTTPKNPGKPNPGKPKPGDPKPGDPKPGDPKPGDPKPGDPKPGDPDPGDPQDAKKE